MDGSTSSSCVPIVLAMYCVLTWLQFKGEGNDDLRQDAVMEQVFQLCNKVLQRDRETAKRKLHIRPYKVVPLSPKAGMLEFVTNTTPLGEWLPAAHQK